MTALPPDPDPRTTPDLEPGGGVPPGSTPPDSAQTSGLGESAAPTARRKLSPAAVVSLIALAVFLSLFVATGVFLLLDM